MSAKKSKKNVKGTRGPSKTLITFRVIPKNFILRDILAGRQMVCEELIPGDVVNPEDFSGATCEIEAILASKVEKVLSKAGHGKPVRFDIRAEWKNSDTGKKSSVTWRYATMVTTRTMDLASGDVVHT